MYLKYETCGEGANENVRELTTRHVEHTTTTKIREKVNRVKRIGFINNFYTSSVTYLAIYGLIYLHCFFNFDLATV